jgi:DNA-binding CsgD family transcriptional regulator
MPRPVPLVIVEGTDEDFEAALVAIRTDGWELRPGWETVDDAVRPGLVFFGPVGNDRSAALATMAAARGAGVVVRACGSPDVTSSLFEDLRRIGRVDYRPAGEAERSPVELLDAEQLHLLDSLARGMSVSESARQLPCSRRTAQRRLADARRMLDVASNTEAVLLTRRDESSP